MTHLIYSLIKLEKTFKLPKKLLKTELDHDGINENTWKNKKDEWLLYVKNDVLFTDYSYACYCKAMEELTGFIMKDCWSLPGLGWKYFNSFRTEKAEPINPYDDKYMRWFVPQSIKGGRVGAFNQYYKSKICDDILEYISEELNVEGNIYDKIEAYLEYKKKHFRIFEKDYENQFTDYRDEDEDGKQKHLKEKLGELPIHQLLKQIKLDELLWDFNAVSLYPSAIQDEESIYPRIVTGYAFTRDLNKFLVHKFNNGNFNHGSAILKIKYYNPKD